MLMLPVGMDYVLPQDDRVLRISFLLRDNPLKAICRTYVFRV